MSLFDELAYLLTRSMKICLCLPPVVSPQLDVAFSSSQLTRVSDLLDFRLVGCWIVSLKFISEKEKR
jgi:hypothetical protein